MPNDLQKIPGGVIEMGVDTFTPDFAGKLVLAPTSKNLTTGINQGTGPRYGISPIPGHSTKDVVTAANGRGLRSAELSSGSALDVFNNRYKFLGIAPISVPDYTTPTSQIQLFLWLIADLVSSKYPLTATPNAVFTDGGAAANTFAYNSDISYGFYNPVWDQVKGDGAVFTDQEASFLSPVMRRVAGSNPSNQNAQDFMKNAMQVDSGTFYCSSAVISVSGRQIPMKWFIGNKVANGDATNTATANFVFLTISGFVRVGLGGICPAWNLGNFRTSIRPLVFYNIASQQLIRTYSYDAYQVASTTYVATYNQNYSTSNFSLSGASSTQTANTRGAAFVAANIGQVLMRDDALTCDSSYTIHLVAAKKPLAYVIQPWERDFTGRAAQAVSLTDRPFSPKLIATIDDAAGLYKENSVVTQTCWSYWPSFTTGTGLRTNASAANAAALHLSLGAPGSGILRKSTVYEFAYSIFDKQLGIESNVGKPAKVQTGGTDDFIAISMLRDVVTAGVFQQYCPVFNSSPQNISDWAQNDGTYGYLSLPFNFLELRIYYRPFGSFEWLPALFIDMAEYAYYPDYKIQWACTGAIPALPGGQPGAFVDYSFLPDDQYDCVVNFKNRAFWLSPKNLVFSLQNNPFAYPLRNSAPAPTGGFKGAIIHTYRGQSEQESRLIIFGQKETYIGRFTGIFQQMPVAVSPDVIASYDVDGSDFTIEPWTSITAFSHRAAVVADGILYWWGAQGIYRDDGVNVPTKISTSIEPNIFDLYDQSLTAEIHCIYDEKTKDIIWFYPPRDANTKTYAIAYDVQSEEFQFEEFDCKIDWATRISTNNPGVSQKTNGLRTIIAARKTSAETIQRGYFFDQENRSGDMRPETELICKSVTTVSATSKTLAFDSGLDATNFATIAVGDYIAVQQFKKYTGQSTGDDIIAKVTAINLITPSLTIQIPSGSVLPAVTLTERAYFPIWHKAANGQGLNGIPWVWESKYWMPNGPDNFMIWHYLYLFFKYTTWKKIDPITFAVAYRTATGAAMISDTCRFRDNSDTNFQLFHALRLGQDNSIGQALKLKLSGTHIGEEWALQYLEAHVMPQDGNYLKQFEG